MSDYGDHYYIPYNWYNVGGSGGLGDGGSHWLTTERSSLNGYYGLPNSGLCSGIYTAFASAIAGQIDGKVDDGLPLTGNVRMLSTDQTTPRGLGVMNAGYPEYGNCATTNVIATSQYKSEESKETLNGRQGCRLAFKSSF